MRKPVTKKKKQPKCDPNAAIENWLRQSTFPKLNFHFPSTPSTNPPSTEKSEKTRSYAVIKFCGQHYVRCCCCFCFWAAILLCGCQHWSALFKPKPSAAKRTGGGGGGSGVETLARSRPCLTWCCSFDGGGSLADDTATPVRRQRLLPAASIVS